jgi:GNAT superfamily N-acetyltransferase
MGAEYYTLKTGETLRVTSIPAAGAGLSQQRLETVHDLIVQPRTPWFSAAERKHLDGALRGSFRGVARDHFVVGWIGEEAVGNVYYGTADGLPDIGLMAYVITAPEHRGKGICSALARVAVDCFVGEGGVCLHLGTNNPAARNVYQGCGFRAYNGQVMRYLRPGLAWDGFDDDYYAWAGPAQVRPGQWGDLARVGALYVAPHRWFVKDYPQRIYSHPAIVHQRCGSILPSMMDNAIEGEGGLWVLENPAGRIVGAATATRWDSKAQGHAPVLDLLVAPSYVRQAAELLLAVLEAQLAAGAEQVQIYIASCDREKAGLVRNIGFRHEATLAGQFRAGTDCYDLDILVWMG